VSSRSAQCRASGTTSYPVCAFGSQCMVTHARYRITLPEKRAKRQ
jgi:hypothetical protein